jgi:hypothetical protein
MKYALISEKDLHDLVLLAGLAEYRTKMKFTLTDTLKELERGVVDLSEDIIIIKAIEEYGLNETDKMDAEYLAGYSQGILDLIEEFT